MIALELYGSDSLALKTDQIFQRFNERSEDKLEGFPGVVEDDIYIIEDLCKINIQLFNVDYDVNGENCGRIDEKIGTALFSSCKLNSL